MAYLVTGAAGFIGFHTAMALLSRGQRVIGVDNINDYYSPALKNARLEVLQKHPNAGLFAFEQINLADQDAMSIFVESHCADVEHVVHLAAQAGVRYSMENPYAYVESNVMGHIVMLEMARTMPKLKHVVYASSSSVYGANTKIPFSLEDPVDKPVSLYAATKRADELISWNYAHIYGLPSTGLRFFTVYGPWGRPDMAYYKFALAMKEGKAIDVYDEGKLQRDFTYIDDIVSGVLSAIEHMPTSDNDSPPHQVFNLGNHTPVSVMDLIRELESALGKKAKINFKPRPPGDVAITYADIEVSKQILGYIPKINLSGGISNFSDWFREYHG